MKKLLILFTALCVLLSCGSQDKPKVKILAHRGLCTTGVNFTTDENTLEALRRAQEEGVDGVIVPMDNEGCAAGIAALLRDPQKLMQLSNACKKRDYSNAGETEKLYQLMEASYA